MAEPKSESPDWRLPPPDPELIGVIKDGYRSPKRKRPTSPQEPEPAPQFEWSPPPADPELIGVIKDGYRSPKPRT